MSDSEEQFNHYYRKGKRYYKLNKYQQSIAALKQAYEIKPSEELQSKINKLEDLIKPQENSEFEFKQDENKTLIDGKFYVNTADYEKLYNYQREGVLWLFKLFQSRKGGILADDMGLGKTVQVIFFLRELYESDLIKSALIVMPKSLLINWERELKKWAPDLTVLMYLGSERERNVAKVRRRGGILLTTYGTVMHSWDDLNSDPNFKWNVLALDEGHKIKNPSSKTFKTINALRADMRLVITGTAVQNKLKELWALFDFTHQGSLLGSYPTFSIEYERPLTSSRNKDATESEKIYGNDIADSLKKLIKPYFLRRTKEEVTKTIEGTDGKSVPKLMRKNDLIVWIQMTDTQIDIYHKFLQMDDVKRLLTMSEKRSPLLELNILKKICDHPRLMPAEHCAELGMTFAESIKMVDITMLQKESGKMEFLLRLLKELVEQGHKCLVFSQSKVVLNIVQRILASNKVQQLRLDGDVLKPSDRQDIVDKFNNVYEYRVLLLTSQVGGVGLTLTGADRAIIYDLSWNPSVDAQAVDRLYRIGQLKNVVVYRLITCGTVEEKIYRRQIFKDSVNRQTTGIQQTDKNPFRYFTQGELLELFTLDDPMVSNTQIQLDAMHSQYRKSDHKLDEHFSWLNEQNIFGVSDHDLMFTQEEDTVDVDEETREKLLVNMRIAEERLQKEAKTSGQDEESQLRQMMSTMSLNEYKYKTKEKAANPHLFIPSKADIKKPLYNVPSNTASILPYLQALKAMNIKDNQNSASGDLEERIVIESDEEEADEVQEISDDDEEGGVVQDKGEWPEYVEEDYNKENVDQQLENDSGDRSQEAHDEEEEETDQSEGGSVANERDDTSGSEDESSSIDKGKDTENEGMSGEEEDQRHKEVHSDEEESDEVVDIKVNKKYGNMIEEVGTVCEDKSDKARSRGRLMRQLDSEDEQEEGLRESEEELRESEDEEELKESEEELKESEDEQEEELKESEDEQEEELRKKEDEQGLSVVDLENEERRGVLTSTPLKKAAVDTGEESSFNEDDIIEDSF